MRQNLINIGLFLVAAAILTFLWQYAEKHWIPRPKPQQAAKKQSQDRPSQADSQKRPEELRRQAIAAIASAVASVVEPQRIAPPPSPPPPAPTLIPLGNADLQVLLSTRGGGVQQVVLTRFDAADRLGREVRRKDANGQPTAEKVPLYLIPGVRTVRTKYLREDYVEPILMPGIVTEPYKLAEPSYRVFHYSTLEDKYPDPYLGDTEWRVVQKDYPDRFSNRYHTPAFARIWCVTSANPPPSGGTTRSSDRRGVVHLDLPRGIDWLAG